MAEDKNAQLDIEDVIDKALAKTQGGMITISKENAWYYATILDSLKLSMIVDQTHEMAVLGHIIRVLRGEPDTLVIREEKE